MYIPRLIFSTTLFYWKRNLGLALSVAIATAVITGALLVGDSVRHSLEQTVYLRLGNVSHSITAGDSYFTQTLANRLDSQIIGKASAALRLDGSASVQGNKLSLSKVAFWGFDDRFGEVLGSWFFDSIPAGEAIISENMALGLNLKEGDFLLVKMEKPTAMPKNTPFVTDQDQYQTRRIKVHKIATKDELGRFGLRNSQTAPYNVFVPIDWLQETMDFPDRANTILLDSQKSKDELFSALRKEIRLPDLGLTVKQHPEGTRLIIGSEKVFITEKLAHLIHDSIWSARGHISYFANSMTVGNRSTPYSFVSTQSSDYLGENEISINSWLAEDLEAKKGDTLTLEYYTIGRLRELNTHTRKFKVRNIIPIEEQEGDDVAVPDIPGLSDTEKCSEWETGLPIDLQAIRDKDERYWYDYGATPKAFINEHLAARLWQNRFGTYTGFIVHRDEYSADTLQQRLLEVIDPSLVGFQVNEIRTDALYAARNATDFSQLFIGLSFFIIVSALLLVSLLFLFNLEQRGKQIGHFAAMGFGKKMIRRIILSEALLVAFLGTLLGLVLAIAYNELVFHALSRVWKDIVRTTVLEPIVSTKSLIWGFLSSMFVSVSTLLISLNRMLRRSVTHMQKQQRPSAKRKSSTWIKTLLLLMVGALAYITISQIFKADNLDPNLFFMAGGLFLVASILAFHLLFDVLAKRKVSEFTQGRLLWLNLSSKPRQSLILLILLSIGAFLVVSTGANRQDLYSSANSKTSGTGGFDFVAQSTLPVLKDLNQKSTQLDLGLDENFAAVQFRKHTGDDASCLNLNRISNPMVLGSDPSLLDGRFSFVSKSDELDEQHPWLSLNQDLGEAIPAIADQTVIQWGLGKKVGDTLLYQNQTGDTLYLKLIGGLAGSVFQGNILISETNFLEHFPSSSGSSFFLIETNASDPSGFKTQFEKALRDLGWSMTPAADKLAEFKSVENTYLDIFLLLGALGLLLGTVGLAIVLARNILDRQKEIALYFATGYGYWQTVSLLFREYFYLLILGSATGLFGALLAVLPKLSNTTAGIPLPFILMIMAVVVVHGAIWIFLISVVQTKRIKLMEALRNE